MPFLLNIRNSSFMLLVSGAICAARLSIPGPVCGRRRSCLYQWNHVRVSRWLWQSPVPLPAGLSPSVLPGSFHPGTARCGKEEEEEPIDMLRCERGCSFRQTQALEEVVSSWRDWSPGYLPSPPGGGVRWLQEPEHNCQRQKGVVPLSLG